MRTIVPIILYFPTLALSKSGYGSRPVSLLSAYFSKLPFVVDNINSFTKKINL